jgi:hypothetical protein
MDQLRHAWLKFDPEGTGTIAVEDYFTFVINLPTPLRTTEEQFLKKLGKYMFEYKGSIVLKSTYYFEKALHEE